MKLGKFQGFCYQFLFTFVIFALMSEIFHGQPELARNACWATGFTVVFAIRDELKPATQRIFNLVMFGVAIVLMPIAIFYSTNTTSDYVVEGLVLVYSIYRFYESYVTRTGERDGSP